MKIDALTTCRALNLTAKERLVYLVLSCYADEKGKYRLSLRQLRDDIQVSTVMLASSRLDDLVNARATYSITEHDDGSITGYLARLSFDRQIAEKVPTEWERDMVGGTE